MKTKVQLKINGELKEVEIENGEITIIEPEKKQAGWEKVKPSKDYWMLITGGLTNFIENESNLSKKAYDTANYFSNNELAVNIIKAQTLQRKFWRWQAENDAPPTIERWGIEWDSPCYLTPAQNYSYRLWDFLYFSSREKAVEFIEAFKDDLLWLFTEFKWRMDGKEKI